jgi:hypothetical protein
MHYFVQLIECNLPHCILPLLVLQNVTVLQLTNYLVCVTVTIKAEVWATSCWKHLPHLLSCGLESNLCAGVAKTEAEREAITNDYLENNSFSLLCTFPSPGQVQLAIGILHPILCQSTKIWWWLNCIIWMKITHDMLPLTHMHHVLSS